MSAAGTFLARILPRVWERRGPLAWLLWPASILYRVLVVLRRALYRAGCLPSGGVPVPVMVVGNAVAGGAGKTPTVMAIVRHLQARGLRPGVVSRGYGRHGIDCREVMHDSQARDVGDEPLLISAACKVPVFVAPRRLDAVRALLARYPGTQVVVCDDGLQHYALLRDIEIGLLDERGIGNGLLLPAGPLREPWPRAVDLLLHTDGRTVMPGPPGFTSQRALAKVAHRADGSTVPLADLRAQPLLALAGIARPEAFFAMLREQDLTLAATVALPDHHDFSNWSHPLATTHELICTEKDAVKLWRQHPQALAVPLIFSPEPAFLVALDAALDAALGRLAVPNPGAKLSSPHGHPTT